MRRKRGIIVPAFSSSYSRIMNMISYKPLIIITVYSYLVIVWQENPVELIADIGD